MVYSKPERLQARTVQAYHTSDLNTHTSEERPQEGLLNTIIPKRKLKCGLTGGSSYQHAQGPSFYPQQTEKKE